METDLTNILIRCDSSFTLGLGHVKRCLLLAQRLTQQDTNLNISFATQNLKGHINFEIEQAGFKVYTLKSSTLDELNALIALLDVTLLIIDSYEIDVAFEKALKIKHEKLKLLSFDDTLQSHYSDMVLNHGIHANEEAYKMLVPKSCQLFCGSQYTLLRDEFFDNYEPTWVKKSVAIILGGNDVLNASFMLSKLLIAIDSNFKITIITSGVNPHLKELSQLSHVELLVDISTIAQTLVSKELVICASGGTLFEVMALRKKFINIQVASNQQNVVDFLYHNHILTTLDANEISQAHLEEKLAYVFEHDIYENLSLNFSKYALPKAILKELK